MLVRFSTNQQQITLVACLYAAVPKNSCRAVTAAATLYFQSIAAADGVNQTHGMLERTALSKRPQPGSSEQAKGAERKNRPSFLRRWLVALLSGTLCAAPAIARALDDSSLKPLGSIAETTRAQVDGVSALSGATVYRGDVVKTDTGGALHLRLGSGQLFLSASSSASLEQRGELASVTLVRGSVSFSLPDPLQFELDTPAGTLRGSGTHSTSGRVVIFGPHQIVVTASRGDLILDNSGELHLIPEGKSYRIVIDDESPTATAASARASDARKRVRQHRRKLFFFLLASGSTVATRIPAGNYGLRSPD
jgi:hypothetical protein